MTDEMKLLRAFIEASGYEIKDVHTKTYGHTRELNHNEKMFGGIRGELEFQGDGLYKEVTRHLDYKVTKRKSSCCIVNIEQDGKASFSDDDTPDYCSYPTQLKISVVDGEVSVKQVGVNEEWEELSNENI